MRNLSPLVPKNDDMEVKFCSLKRGYWTGMTENCLENNEGSETNFPLSWGLPNSAANFRKDNDALLM